MRHNFEAKNVLKYLVVKNFTSVANFPLTRTPSVENIPLVSSWCHLFYVCGWPIFKESVYRSKWNWTFTLFHSVFIFMISSIGYPQRWLTHAKGEHIVCSKSHQQNYKSKVINWKDVYPEFYIRLSYKIHPLEKNNFNIDFYNVPHLMNKKMCCQIIEYASWYFAAFHDNVTLVSSIFNKLYNSCQGWLNFMWESSAWLSYITLIINLCYGNQLL